MPEDVRVAIERAAFVSGRTVTAEINMRLKASLEAQDGPPSSSLSRHQSEEPYTLVSDIDPPGGPKRVVVARVGDTQISKEKSLVSALSGTDQAMLEVFRSLPPEKQLALLSLFR